MASFIVGSDWPLQPRIHHRRCHPARERPSCGLVHRDCRWCFNRNTSYTRERRRAVGARPIRVRLTCYGPCGLARHSNPHGLAHKSPRVPSQDPYAIRGKETRPIPMDTHCFGARFRRNFARLIPKRGNRRLWATIGARRGNTVVEPLWRHQPEALSSCGP